MGHLKPNKRPDFIQKWRLSEPEYTWKINRLDRKLNSKRLEPLPYTPLRAVDPKGK